MKKCHKFRYGRRLVDTDDTKVVESFGRDMTSLWQNYPTRDPNFLFPILPYFRVPRKFSGNAVRVSRRVLLYHGTILYDFPIAFMRRYLREPIRRPDYRGTRNHDQFLTNFPVSREEIIQAIIRAFSW